MTGLPQDYENLNALTDRVVILEGRNYQPYTPGEFHFFPFRTTELPEGFYHANGDRYSLSSPQGQVLNTRSEAYKTDWGLTVVSDTIDLPNWYKNGRGYFFRAGTTPGVEQEDAIRNIKNDPAINNVFRADVDTSWAGGAPADSLFHPFVLSYKEIGKAQYPTPADPAWWSSYYSFDVSTSVPTADDNRPLNKTLVPAVYLGV
jgi:hypothetical protein